MPLLVLPRGTWGTVQLQISSGKIAWREKNGGSSQFTEWALAQVGYADTAGVADKSNGLGGHSFIDAFPVGNLGWILGLDVANDQLRPFPPDKVSVGYANSAGSANMKVYAAWHSNAAAALPAGGTWIWIKYANYPDRYNYCNAGTAAGGTWIGDESGIGGNTSGVSICAFKIAA